jgi:hypothetical protein
MAKKKDDGAGIQVTEIERRIIRFNVVGTTPFVANRMSEKVKMGLLLPKGGRMTQAEKAANLKHDPRKEFQNSVYMLPSGPYTHPQGPTLVAVPAAAFKRAIANAALDIPGAKKAQIGRLSWVESQYLPLYGIPELFMAVVRQAGIDRTPDIRTRAIFPRWATSFEMSFIRPLLNETTLANLLGAAGLIVGVGDGRQEKGALNFGQFRFCADNDEEFMDIVKSSGRDVQEKALETCKCYDEETERLLDWYDVELNRRGLKVAG